MASGGQKWGNRWVFPPCSDVARSYKIGGVFYENQNRDLEVLTIRAYFEIDCAVQKISISTQARERISKIENALGNATEMFTNLLSKALNMCPGISQMERKVIGELGEIETLYNIAEYIMELKDRVEI